jgi:hypothetical protein
MVAVFHPLRLCEHVGLLAPRIFSNCPNSFEGIDRTFLVNKSGRDGKYTLDRIKPNHD